MAVMSQKIQFSKLHGLGNDFVVINALSQRVDVAAIRALTPELCDRHFGIGADGVILVSPSATADFKMTIFNADGSEPETCGNGLRCFAKFIHDDRVTDKDVFSVETGAGTVIPALIKQNGAVSAVEVDMGAPILNPPDIPVTGITKSVSVNEPILVNGREFIMTCVSMGNPHAVIFVPDLKELDIETLGPAFERHPRFPKGVNTEFVQVMSRSEAVMIVWERGAGETLACGTGACAVTVAGVLTGQLDRKALIHLPGGDLTIEWQESDNHVSMVGPAELVYRGEFLL